MKCEEQTDFADNSKSRGKTSTRASLRDHVIEINERLFLAAESWIEELKMSRIALNILKTVFILQYVAAVLLLYNIATQTWLTNGDVTCSGNFEQTLNGSESLLLASVCRNPIYRDRFVKFFLTLETLSLVFLVSKLFINAKYPGMKIADFVHIDDRIVFGILMIPRVLIYLLIPIQSALSVTAPSSLGTIFSILRSPISFSLSFIIRLVTLPISIFFPYSIKESVEIDFNGISHILQAKSDIQMSDKSAKISVNCFEHCQVNFEASWMFSVVFVLLNYSAAFWCLALCEGFQEFRVDSRRGESREQYSDGVEFIRISEVSEDFSYEGDSEKGRNSVEVADQFQIDEAGKLGEGKKEQYPQIKQDNVEQDKQKEHVVDSLRSEVTATDSSIEIREDLTKEAEAAPLKQADTSSIEAEAAPLRQADTSSIEQSIPDPCKRGKPPIQKGIVSSLKQRVAAFEQDSAKKDSRKLSEVDGVSQEKTVRAADLIKRFSSHEKIDVEVPRGRESVVREAGINKSERVVKKEISKGETVKTEVFETTNNKAETVKKEIKTTEIDKAELTKEKIKTDKGVQTYNYKINKSCQTFVPIHLHKKVNKKTQVSPILVDAETNTEERKEEKKLLDNRNGEKTEKTEKVDLGKNLEKEDSRKEKDEVGSGTKRVSDNGTGIVEGKKIVNGNKAEVPVEDKILKGNQEKTDQNKSNKESLQLNGHAENSMLEEIVKSDIGKKFGFAKLLLVPPTLDFERRIIRENEIGRLSVDAFLKHLKNEEDGDMIYVEKELLLKTFKEIVVISKIKKPEEELCPRSNEFVPKCVCQVHAVINTLTKQEKRDEVDGLRMETEEDDLSDDDESFFNGFRL